MNEFYDGPYLLCQETGRIGRLIQLKTPDHEERYNMRYRAWLAWVKPQMELSINDPRLIQTKS